MERVAIYLRKSRADLEAEARGEGETLSKHKKALLHLAKQKNLNILKISQEIVSGESLIHRPEMLKLLQEVENNLYDAVLVMDIDRLGRGNMKEQGIILETFQQSNTKIITPRKEYNLKDEFDEEYTEFEAFMARKELKIITRRLQGGRIRSVEEGNYIGARPPYGYQIVKQGRERYLTPDPIQAPIVKIIFNLYTKKQLGANKIANQLNELGLTTYTGKKWANSSVLTIIKNAVYTGRLQWKKKKSKKSSDPSKRREIKTRPISEWIDVPGKHEPLISLETFEQAQEILKKKYHVPFQSKRGITNPLAGLIKCELCHTSMVLRPYTKQLPHLICHSRLCKNKSTRFSYIENRLLEALESWLQQYAIKWSTTEQTIQDDTQISAFESLTKSLQQEQINLNSQKERLHDLLERGIYSEETFIERSNHIANRINQIQDGIKKNLVSLEEEKTKAQLDIIPKVKYMLDLYPSLNTAKEKNTLLKSILHYCTYKKIPSQRGDEFTLVLYPKV